MERIPGKRLTKFTSQAVMIVIDSESGNGEQYDDYSTISQMLPISLLVGRVDKWKAMEIMSLMNMA